MVSIVALLSLVASWGVLSSRGTFMIPRTGPAWRLCLRGVHGHLAEAVLRYADEHDGRFPDDLHVLAGKYALPLTDPVAAYWLARAHFWLAFAMPTGAALSLTLFAWFGLERKRYGIAAAACAIGAVVCPLPPPAWFPSSRSYDYLDRFVVIPGLRRPIPDRVPVIWAQEPYKLPRWDRDYCSAHDRGQRWHWTSSCGFNGERLVELLATARADRTTLVASAEKGDLDALLVLATTPELRAGDTFVGIPNGGCARAIALMGLHNLDDPRTVVEARKALASTSSTVRQYAAQLLGHRRAPGTTEVLTPLLRDKDGDVRTAAIAALGCDGDPRAIGLLRSVLRKHRFAEEPLLALGRMRTKEAVAALCDEMGRKPDYFRKTIVTKALPLAGELAVPALAALIPAASHYEVFGIIEGLGSTRSEAAVEPLVGLVTREPRPVGLALARIRVRGRRTPLDLAQARSYEERLCAAAGLGHTRPPQAVESLIPLMSDPSIVGTEAARVLGRHRDPRAVDALIEALSRSDSPLRQAAARSLLSLGAVRAIPAIRRAAKAAPKGEDERQLMDCVARALEVYQRYLKSRDRQDGG